MTELIIYNVAAYNLQSESVSFQPFDHIINKHNYSTDLLNVTSLNPREMIDHSTVRALLGE